MKVTEVRITPIDTREALRLTWGQTKREFREEGTQLFIQTTEQELLDSMDGKIFLRPGILEAITEKDGVFRWTWERGLIIDFASVPRRLRSIIDDDDPRIVPAAVGHDILFLLNALSFWRTNKIFRQVIRKCGGSRFMAWSAWLAVSSPFGRAKWRKSTQDKEKAGRFCSFEWADKPTLPRDTE